MQNKQIDLALKSPTPLSLKAWVRVIAELIIGEDKPTIIAVSGASGSGKGYATDLLQEMLAKKELRSKVISTDNYYRGISFMLAKLLEVELNPTQAKVVEKEILKQTIDLPFNEKFSAETLRLIYKNIPEGIYQTFKAFQSQLLKARDLLDFDTPHCVGLDEAAQALVDFKYGKSIVVPEYSMYTGERMSTLLVRPQDVDVLIIEGIYGLTKQISKQAALSAAIYCPEPVLLLRRLRRDAGRTSFPQEKTLQLFLTKMLPGYNTYVRDDILKNNLITHNSLAPTEVTTGVLRPEGLPKPSYTFRVKGDFENKYLINIYLKNAQLLALDFHYCLDKEIVFSEFLIEPDGFGQYYHDPKTLYNDFINAGFEAITPIR